VVDSDIIPVGSVLFKGSFLSCMMFFEQKDIEFVARFHDVS
jgi:hypothetical protein